MYFFDISYAHLYAFSLRERTIFRGDRLFGVGDIVAERTDFRCDII